LPTGAFDLVHLDGDGLGGTFTFMPRDCQLTVSIASAAPKQLKLSFTDDEWRILEDFANFARQVMQLPIVAEGRFNSSMTVKFDQTQGLRMEASLPPWDEVALVLHRLRPLVLAKEPTFLNAVANILARRGDDANWRSMLDGWKQVFAGKEITNTATITVTTPILKIIANSEAALELYLNAHEYHRDADKREKIDSLYEVIPEDSSRALFVQLLIDKIRAISHLAGLIDTLAGRQTEYHAQVPTPEQKKPDAGPPR
jgi:hypothetical protein